MIINDNIHDHDNLFVKFTLVLRGFVTLFNFAEKTKINV